MEGQTGPYRRATILVNPRARGIGRFDGEAALRFLRRRGIEAHLEAPASPIEAGSVAEAAANREDDILFVVGGDGSLRDAARGAAGSPLALAAIPAGTANVVAKEVHLPRGIRTAFETHLGGQSVPTDLGRANGEPFVMMAGIGWDADVVQSLRPGLKRRAAQLAYVESALERARRLRKAHARWSSGLAHWEGDLALMVVGNTRLYGGVVELTPEAKANDGELDFVALCPARPGDGIRLAAKLLLHRAHGDHRALTGRSPEIEFETPGIPYQLDGDYAGETPLRLSVEREAVRLSVPAGPLPAAWRK